MKNKFLQVLIPGTLVPILYKHRTVYKIIIGSKASNPLIRTVLPREYQMKSKGVITKIMLQKQFLMFDSSTEHLFLYNYNILFKSIQEGIKKVNLDKQFCLKTNLYLKHSLSINRPLSQSNYKNNKGGQLLNQEITSNFIKSARFFPVRQNKNLRPLKPCLATQAQDPVPFNKKTTFLFNEIYWTYLGKSLSILQKVTTFQNKFLPSLITNSYMKLPGMLLIKQKGSIRYKLQKQSVKYKIPFRTTCKLFIVYAFGSFCWLYLINYSPKKEKFTETSLPQTVSLFQEIVINNLPLFQKNYEFYTKETSENIIFKQQHNSVYKEFFDLKGTDIKNSPHKFFHILEDSGEKQSSLLFREIFLQNYVGILNNGINNEITRPKTSSQLDALLKETNKTKFGDSKDSEFIFFARKPICSIHLPVKQLLQKNNPYFGAKPSPKLPFIGPEFDFLPRRIDKMDKKNRFPLTGKKNRHNFDVTFNPKVGLTEQVQLFNYFNESNLTLQLGMPSREAFKGLSSNTYGVITDKKHNTYVKNQYVTPAPIKLVPAKAQKRKDKKNQRYFFRTLLCDNRLILNKTNPFIDILSDVRLQSGFNFPDAPVIPNNSFLVVNRFSLFSTKVLQSKHKQQKAHTKLINKKHVRRISVKTSPPCLEVRPSTFSSFLEKGFLQSKKPEIAGEKNQFTTSASSARPLLTGRSSKSNTNKKSSSVGLLKKANTNTSFLELVYKPKLLQGLISYDEKGGYIHYQRKKHSSSRNFFEPVKNIIVKVPSFASQIMGLKAWSNRTYPFVTLDKHADIKILKNIGSSVVRVNEAQKHEYSHKNKISGYASGTAKPPFSTNTGYPSDSNFTFNSIDAVMGKRGINKYFEPKEKQGVFWGKGLLSTNGPESFFGTPFLQFGERFTVDYLKGKNQMGLIFNVHTGAVMNPITKPILPYASTGTSLNTVFGKKQLTTAKAKKAQNPVTNGRLVSQWFIANAPAHGKDISKNNLLDKSFLNTSGTSLGFEELPWSGGHPAKAFLGRLFSVKSISGKANRYTINPFMYYNPGTKRDRNIEDTMLTLEGFKKSRLFPNTHIYNVSGGITLPLISTKPLQNKIPSSGSDWALDDPHLQSILGGMRQRIEPRRIAQNVTGAPISNTEELQKNLSQKSSNKGEINNFNQDLLGEQEDEKRVKGFSKEQKRKKFNSTNCYPLRTLLTVCSHKSLSPLRGYTYPLRPTDQTEYFFCDWQASTSSFYLGGNFGKAKAKFFTMPVSSKVYHKNNKLFIIPTANKKRGSGTTKGFYLENIFSPAVCVQTKDLNNGACMSSKCTSLDLIKVEQKHQHEQNNMENMWGTSYGPSGLISKYPSNFSSRFLWPLSVPSTGSLVDSLVLGISSTNIIFNLSKILFVAAVWFSYKFLATPLSQSTELLPAAFTEAVGLQSFQKKFRIISANKTTQSFKNLAGAEKTLSELRDLIWTFRLVGTGGPRGEHSPLSRFPYIGSASAASKGQHKTVALPSADSKVTGAERSSIFSKARNRFLLVGPPGTGKTLLVKALAAEANVPVIVQPVSQLRMIAGVENPVSALFHVARQIKPCIIFLDELDTLGNNVQSDINATTGEQKLGIPLAQKYTYTLLLELDGLTSSTRDLLIIGATNRPETLNPALTRSGRFDTFINCNLPSQEQRIAVLSLYLSNPYKKNKQHNRENGTTKILMPRVAHTKNYNVELPEVLQSNPVKSTQNLEGFYINYVASRCFGLSQASIGAVVNESALESMLHPYSPNLHTLKTLERAIESVKTLTPQAFTGASKHESDFANETISTFFGNNKNSLQKFRVNNETLGNNSDVSAKKDKIIGYTDGTVKGHSNQKLTSSTSYLLPGRPQNKPLMLLRSTGEASNSSFLFNSATRQKMQFLVYRAYQTASSPIFLYKAQKWGNFNTGLNILFFQKFSEKTAVNGSRFASAETKQKKSISQKFNISPKDKQLLNKKSLEENILRSYAQQAAVSLYGATRPQNFKLFDMFGFCQRESVEREVTLLGLKELWGNGSGLKVLEKSSLGNSYNTDPEKNNFLQRVNGFQKSFTPYKPLNATTKRVELLFKHKNFHNMLSNLEDNGAQEKKYEKTSSFLASQVRTSNPLPTGWFRMYLARPLVRYDSLSYIENREYYPQNYYALKKCFARSSRLRNVSTLSHLSSKLTLNNKNFSDPKINSFPTFMPTANSVNASRSVLKSGLFNGGFKGPFETPGNQFFSGVEGKRNYQNHFFSPKVPKVVNQNNALNLSMLLEHNFSQQFQPIYLTLIAYFFHKACYLYKENRELLDYCVYNKLRYSALYEFFVKQICNKF